MSTGWIRQCITAIAARHDEQRVRPVMLYLIPHVSGVVELGSPHVPMIPLSRRGLGRVLVEYGAYAAKSLASYHASDDVVPTL